MMMPRFDLNDHGPRTLDDRSVASGAARAGGAARGALLALALPAFVFFLAACSSPPEATNRDRLPRRNPNDAPADTATPDTTKYQPPAVREGLFLNYADYERQRAGALSDLDLAIGTPQAETVTQCRVVPVGQKACGGPAAYRVYSASGDDELLIIQLAARVSAMDTEANEQFELASDCDVQPEPGRRRGRRLCRPIDRPDLSPLAPPARGLPCRLRGRHPF